MDIEDIAENKSIECLGRVSPAFECGFTQGANYMIDKACEWLKSKGAFCYAGQYNNNEVSESEFREAMKG